MNIEKIPISKINQANFNPRKDLQPEDEEYQKLERSIKFFGFIEPLVWNKRSGNIVGGHQRFKILKSLNYKEIECVVVDYDEEKEKAANIALNKISGEWNYPKLKEILVEMDNGSFDFTVTGFTEKEMDVMVNFEGGFEEKKSQKEIKDKMTTSFEVIIECSGETEQRDTYEKLTGEGFKCRILTF